MENVNWRKEMAFAGVAAVVAFHRTLGPERVGLNEERQRVALLQAL